MVQMKTLTVNGKTYEVADPDAAHIDDTAVGENAWSSRNAVDRLCPAFTESGAVVSCEPVQGYPLGVVSHITLVQEGSGDPSPDNIRPITGWTGAKLHRVGKNLFYSDRTQSNTTCGITCVCTKGSSAIVLDGTATEESSIRFVQNLLLKAGTYTVSVFGTNNIDSAHDRIYLRYTNEDGTVGHVNHIMAGKPKTFTFNADTVIHCDIVYAAGSAYNNKEIFVQIEMGSAATQYEPYRGEEFTLDFGQTVYCGSLDWASGVLTVTHGNIESYSGEAVPEGWISSTGELTQGYQVVYPLAEPITVGLTPQQILALSGINTLYSDTGDTAVTGKADPVAKLERLENAIRALGGSI